MHTPLCGHSVGWPREFVDVAVKRGLGRIAISCHMPIDRSDFGGPDIRMLSSAFQEYLDLVADAKSYGAERGVIVMLGIEGEVCPDPAIQNEIAEFLSAHPFDFVLGSLHHHLEFFRNWFASQGCQSDDELITAYFELLRDGAATGLFDSMSHPDVIRIYGTLRGGFEPLRFESVIREAIAAAVEADVCWEMNTSGRLKGPGIEHPDPLIRAWGQEMGLKLTMGSDAHRPESVGQFFPEMLATLKDEGFDAVHYYEGRKRHAVKLDRLIGDTPVAGRFFRWLPRIFRDQLTIGPKRRM